MEFKKIKIEKLIHADYNPRKDLKAGDSEYEKIKRSIQEFGYVEPVIVNKHGCEDGKYLIVGGHQRTKVMKDLGYEEIDCVVVDMDKNKEKTLNIALNKITGEWDFDQLAVLMEELKLEDYDLELTGFDFSEAERLLDSLKDENEQVEEEEEIEVPENPISQKGDVWLLGKHRLMCGDSTKEEDVAVLMDGEKANLIVTDAPYNVAYQGKTADALTIQNDNMSNEQFFQFLLDSYTRMYEVAEDGASIYMFHADSEGLNFRKAFIDAGFKLAQCCIWAKQAMVMGRQDYHWQHEPVLYGWKPTAAHYWNSDRKQTTLWHFDRPFRNEHHPTMKPVPLIIYPIKNSSKIGDTVLDPFGGSGSTLIACEETDRVCRTMELDEKYADVIVTRYIAHTGADSGVYLIRNGEKIAYSELLVEQ